MLLSVGLLLNLALSFVASSLTIVVFALPFMRGGLR